MTLFWSTRDFWSFVLNKKAHTHHTHTHTHTPHTHTHHTHTAHTPHTHATQRTHTPHTTHTPPHLTMFPAQTFLPWEQASSRNKHVVMQISVWDQCMYSYWKWSRTCLVWWSRENYCCVRTEIEHWASFSLLVHVGFAVLFVVKTNVRIRSSPLCHGICQSTLMSPEDSCGNFAKKLFTKQVSMGPSMKQKICCGVGLNLYGMSKTTRAMVFHLRHNVLLSSMVPEYRNETCFAPSTSRDFAVTCVAHTELHCWTQLKMRVEWASSFFGTACFEYNGLKLRIP